MPGKKNGVSLDLAAHLTPERYLFARQWHPGGCRTANFREETRKLGNETIRDSPYFLMRRYSRRETVVKYTRASREECLSADIREH